MEFKPHYVDHHQTESEWILPRTFKFPTSTTGHTADLHTNTGAGRLPTDCGQCQGGENGRLTYYASNFGGAIRSAKVSGLNTCGGLIVAVRPKKSKGNFSKFIAYHWGGDLPQDMTWANSIKKALPAIRFFLFDSEYAYAACIAGPFHSRNRVEFERPFREMGEFFNFQRLDSFWTAYDEDAQGPPQGSTRDVSLELCQKGKVVVRHL